ncbi:TerD family protein [Streptomyces sp. NPDC002766]|uniref:TerD family protein n=1 Tax=Streptomyces sp. NPDC002766 TaxID=3154429 RepID=UPI003320F81D
MGCCLIRNGWPAIRVNAGRDGDAVNRGRIDVSAVLLKRDGKVRGDEDLVFHNHPSGNARGQVGVTDSGWQRRIATFGDRISDSHR